MRILFLTHSFNSLTQRLHVELTEREHDISIEFDINDAVSIEAVRLFRPELIIAPYLRRAIPGKIWRHHVCLVLHPGIPGDRGPSALDRAVLNGKSEWGVTVLQATGELDAGPVWASAVFRMRAARKSSLYRNEVTEAAVKTMLLAIKRFEQGNFIPSPPERLSASLRGEWQPLLTQSQRRIDWSSDDTQTVLRKINSGDGSPGVEDELAGETCYLYDACEEDSLRGVPGEIIARRYDAICRATRDGAVWIGHLKKIIPGEKTLKLPAAMALEEHLHQVPEAVLPLVVSRERKTYKEIWYEEKGRVGYLHFNFYNGAMRTAQCKRLLEAFKHVRRRPTRVIVLMGGEDFWSNGLHLHCIEAADSPADESWRNIHAMDDLVEAIIRTDTQLTIAALRGNAGAGGAFLALAADRIYARTGVVLNPHYKSMGNLYGSEYWTYLLPRRMGEKGRTVMENRLPLGTTTAKRLGFIDEYFGRDKDDFLHEVESRATALANEESFESNLAEKYRLRLQDEAFKPLQDYRAGELERMKLNFYGFDPSYHVARYNFVFRISSSWTPLHLARHRRTVRNRIPALADVSPA